jgi:alkanesulfonate monooxygenase SsuD/methylene tetrahydromethanopterin reductase-like flavin-dependent oxidoreductase (luciferase family)
LSNRALSFGWIMQPAMIYIPEGVDSRDIRLARDMITANEQHVELARAAGFDTIWVEDHMGWIEKAHLECFTNMAWLAGRHPGLRYGTMVCGQAFRNPAYLAKLAVNMYLLTEGKFILGIGAGNNPGEHHEYGYQFLPAGERLAQTEEAIKIIRALWTDSPATFHGKYYSIDHAYSSPLPDGPIPIMIGGGGEKKTLRLVAQYADWWCADIEPVPVFEHKARVLAEHCAAVGRDPAEIVHSQVVWISVEDDSARAIRWDHLHIVAGNPDEVTRELEAFRDAGVHHFQIRFLDYPNPAGLERFATKVMPRLLSGVPEGRGHGRGLGVGSPNSDPRPSASSQSLGSGQGAVTSGQ